MNIYQSTGGDNKNSKDAKSDKQRSAADRAYRHPKKYVSTEQENDQRTN